MACIRDTPVHQQHGVQTSTALNGCVCPGANSISCTRQQFVQDTVRTVRQTLRSLTQTAHQKLQLRCKESLMSREA